MLQLPHGRARRYGLIGLSVFFIVAGVNHFRDPEFYLAMMPPALPAHGFLVALSGVLEIAGGVAVLVPRLRAMAGWGLVLVLMGMFPANIHMALNAELFADVPEAVLWGRLPFQIVFIAWALWATRPERPAARSGPTAATVAGLLLLAVAACGGEQRAEGPRSAVAHMVPTGGHRASGAVTFTEVTGGIRVVASFVGVPEGAHGFHVHERGDCGSDDGSSAGDHWNPDGTAHGGRLAPIRHVGDLGNVAADVDGVVKVDFIDPVLALTGARSIVGRGFILHAGEDDLISQPSGAAGARIACGVITRSGERARLEGGSR